MNILPWPPQPTGSYHVSYDGGETFVEIAPPPLPQEPEPVVES
jgi:hypothetical protein